MHVLFLVKNQTKPDLDKIAVWFVQINIRIASYEGLKGRVYLILIYNGSKNSAGDGADTVRELSSTKMKMANQRVKSHSEKLSKENSVTLTKKDKLTREQMPR